MRCVPHQCSSSRWNTACTCKGDVDGTEEGRVEHLLLRCLVEVQGVDEAIVSAGDIDLPKWPLYLPQCVVLYDLQEQTGAAVELSVMQNGCQVVSCSDPVPQQRSKPTRHMSGTVPVQGPAPCYAL